MNNLFLVIDANSLIHRAYHALPPLINAAGKPAGALYGLSSMLLKILKDIGPQYAVAAFDRPEPTFRTKEYQAYKENRKATPDELVSQLIIAKDFFKAFGIYTLDAPGYEADDIIGTITGRASLFQEIEKIIILSGDLDVLQLVENNRVIAHIPQKGISSFMAYNREAVIDRFGVPPERIPDFKGLVGDSSDNIPGVYGVGPKTASTLITRYGSLEDLYALSPELKTATLQNIFNNKITALMSKKLATISRDVPIDILSADQFKINLASLNNLPQFLLNQGFRNLSERAALPKPS